MRIGIDGRELLGHRTGVGRYLAELCGQWLELPSTSDHEFVIYTPDAQTDLSALGPPFTSAEPGSFCHHSVRGRPGTWWEQVRLLSAANRDTLDAFFAPAYSAPLRLRAPCVVTMHDVSFAAHPEWFRWQEGLRRRWLARHTMTQASAIIAVSDFSRDEILRCFDLPRERIHVVRSGIRPGPGPVGPTQRDHPSPLVLYVGSVFNRRHVPTLIQAFAEVLAEVPDAELAVVGADRTYPPQDLARVAERAGVRSRVALHAFVPEHELSRLYGRARVFAFLSEYEGFGLPPLEALSAGVPTVVADTPVARELYRDATLFVPLADASATAAAIIALLRDDTLRARQQERATALLPAFTWQRAARETLAILDAAARADR